MNHQNTDLIDWSICAETRSTLGSNFVRILGYFREDGHQSVTDIERAMRTKDAAKIVIPAHTLKGEALQFGAMRLATAAEQIEFIARKSLEHREAPDEIMDLIAGLRPMFEETLSQLGRDSSPVVEQHHAGFGRKYGGLAG